MELRHLQYFKTVAEHLHFRNAAEALFISQPPLSRQIKELEDELGVILFLRNNKRVALTDAGKYFKAEVDDIFARLEESKIILRQIHEAESGELKIGYISSVYQPHLAEVLKEFRAVFPHVKISLYERPTVKQVEALEQGSLDVGILRAPVQSAKLEVFTLFHDPFMVVLPSAGLHFSNNAALAAYIRQKPFIFFNKEYAPHYYASLVEICNRLGFAPDITHEVNNVHSILQLVEAGLGISILPLSLQQQYKKLDISCIPLTDIQVTTEVVVAYKKSNLNKALKWFIDNYTRH